MSFECSRYHEPEREHLQGSRLQKKPVCLRKVLQVRAKQEFVFFYISATNIANI